jgi:translation initiation factor 1 (eIF-1/SUI1)
MSCAPVSPPPAPSGLPASSVQFSAVMSKQQVQLHIQDRRGKHIVSVSLNKDATTEDLKKIFAKECQ